jgi:MoaA/NifB/PqqE/SkfB family radical SAM enzyme
MNEIIKDVHAMGVRGITLSGGGEPLVHRSINRILQSIIDSRLSFSLITNGQRIQSKKAELLKKAKWIRVSMDYYSPESFVISKRGTENMFAKLRDNLKGFTKDGDNDIGVNYVITKENYKHLKESVELAIELGMRNIRYSPVWVPEFEVYHRFLFHPVIRSIKKLQEEYKSDIDIYHSYRIAEKAAKRTYSKCYFQQVVPVIGADLNVYNCHNKAYSPDGMIGSIKDQKFSELWYSEATAKHFKNYDAKEHCKYECANDKKNIFIHELINCHGDVYV